MFVSVVHERATEIVCADDENQDNQNYTPHNWNEIQ